MFLELFRFFELSRDKLFCNCFASSLACGNGYYELVPYLIFCSNIVNYMMCQHEKVHSYFYLALIAYKIVCLCVCMVLAAQLALKEIIN